MPRRPCAVAICPNKDYPPVENLSFHRFPKDVKMRKAWVLRCKRQDNFNPETSRICSEHFSEEDFEIDMKAKLMGTPSKRRLKQDALPSLKLLPEGPQISSQKASAKITSKEARRESMLEKEKKQDHSFEDQQIKAEETDDPSVESCNSKDSSKKVPKKRKSEFLYNSSHKLKTIKKLRTIGASDRGSSGASPSSAHRNGADADSQPYDHFGKYVAAELRGLPQRRAYILQQELQALITHAKLSTLESEDSEGSPDSPTNGTHPVGSNEELLGQFVINTFLPKT